MVIRGELDTESLQDHDIPHLTLRLRHVKHPLLRRGFLFGWVLDVIKPFDCEDMTLSPTLAC
jgi:hypothetical protein